jgi:hypothetical protein
LCGQRQAERRHQEGNAKNTRQQPLERHNEVSADAAILAGKKLTAGGQELRFPGAVRPVS